MKNRPHPTSKPPHVCTSAVDCRKDGFIVSEKLWARGRGEPGAICHGAKGGLKPESEAPPVPVADEAAMKAKGRARFEQFTARLGRRLEAGKSLVRGVVEEFQAKENDFFAMDIGEPANDN